MHFKRAGLGQDLVSDATAARRGEVQRVVSGRGRKPGPTNLKWLHPYLAVVHEIMVGGLGTDDIVLEQKGSVGVD